MQGVRIVVTDPDAFVAFDAGVHVLDAFLRQAAARDVDEDVIDRPETFDLLAGTTRLRELLDAGVPAGDIVTEAAESAAGFEPLRASVLQYE